MILAGWSCAISSRRLGTDVMSYQKIQVEPLSPVIGAEISGVDLSKALDEATCQGSTQR